MTVRHLAIVGPTATGKSALALELARQVEGGAGAAEIVSMDSMQVYRGMDIGTAKPTLAEQAEVPHHVIDVADPAEVWSVALHQAAARAAVASIEARGKRAILVGGTGLYVQAVVDDLDLPGEFPAARAELEAEPDTEALWARLARLDPTAAGRIEPGNRRRVLRALEVTLGSDRPFSSYGPGLRAYPDNDRFVLVGLAMERQVIGVRIAARYQAQLAAGFLDEVRRLAARPGGLSRTAAQALGYRELLAHVAGERTFTDALDEAIRRTRRFARRQEAWFRRDPRVRWRAHDGNAAPLAAAVLEDWKRCS